MTRAIAERVHWSEGLLLAPQHLQQLDAFHSDALATRLSALDPAAFGVRSLVFDDDALRDGTLGITAFEGALPDGLWLAFDAGAGCGPTPRAVEPHFRPGQTSLDVFVAVRRPEQTMPLASDEADCDTRFAIRHRTVADIERPERSIEVATAVPNVKILFGDEERGPYCALKIAELSRSEKGTLGLVSDFIPPLLRIGASAPLLRTLSGLLRLVDARITALAERRRQHHASEVLFQSSDITEFLLLQTLQGLQPVLAHFLAWPEQGSERAFVTLAGLAGQLAPFGHFELSELPAFDPMNLRGSLYPLLRLIQRAVEAPARERCLRLTLESREDGVHFGKLEGSDWDAAGSYFLSVEGNVEEAAVVSELPRLSKISCWSHIAGILSAATPGVPLSVVLRPPAEIPARAGRVYFRLACDNGYWSQVRAEKTLAVYLPAPFLPDTTRVELWAVPTERERPVAAPTRRSANAHSAVAGGLGAGPGGSLSSDRPGAP